MRMFCITVLLAVGLLGCGPVGYLHYVAVKATRAVAHAKTVGAEKLAPYEYWSAVEYLQMARETGAYADYELAHNYGEKAGKMADEAAAIAAKKRDATDRGTDEKPPELAPGSGKAGGHK